MLLDDCYVSFVNLDSRPDRLAHMEAELARANLKATRTRGILPGEYKGDPAKIVSMLSRPQLGAIGCHFSQVSIMEKALALGKHAWVMEDDLIFCSDLHERLKIMTGFLVEHEWDVMWLGASFHVNPPFWHRVEGSGMRPDCSAKLGRDAELTDNPRIVRTFGAFATFAYIVNINSIAKILRLFNRNLHLSIGIDHLFIRLQPELKCFAFVPGCVKQRDGKSDIGTGDTIWSGFLRLNGTIENSAYVFQDRMEQFNSASFDWAEASHEHKVS